LDWHRRISWDVIHQIGGQRQRINVARALVLRPKLLVADEPVSMVDASLRASILETLRGLQKDFGVSIIYITHDLTTSYHLPSRSSCIAGSDGSWRCRHGYQEPKHPIPAC
jgi:ABC-type glutathione transport system ATPase component